MERGHHIGRWVIEAQIGAGAFGTVYQGVDPATGEHVAVKVLEAVSGNTAAATELRAEAAALLAVNSAHCIRVRDLVDDGHTLALVTDLVPGATLKQVLETHGALSPAGALTTLHGALSGLGDVHRAGLLHGDVKPGNIVVDPHGTSRLIDFGLAGPFRALHAGTPAYMSPEHVRGEQLDHRSDLYAVAVLLYELLAGRHPFAGATSTQMLDAHLNHEPAPLSETNPQSGRLLSELCAWGMVKNPDQRPQNAHVFITALEDAATQTYGAVWRTAAAGLGGVVGALLAANPAGSAASVLGAGTAVGSGVAGGGSTAAVTSGTAAVGTGSAAAGSSAAVGTGTAASAAAVSAPASATTAAAATGISGTVKAVTAGVVTAAVLGGGAAVITNLVDDDTPEPVRSTPTAEATPEPVRDAIRDVDLTSVTWFDPRPDLGDADQGRQQFTVTETEVALDGDGAPSYMFPGDWGADEFWSDPQYGDFNGDGYEDVLVPIARADVPSGLTAWYIAVWDPDTDSVRALPEPVTASSRCEATRVENIYVEDNNIVVEEMVGTVDAMVSCAEGPSDAQLVVRKVTLIDDHLVLANDEKQGWGGRCDWPGAGPGYPLEDPLPEVHVARSLDSETVDLTNYALAATPHVWTDIEPSWVPVRLIGMSDEEKGNPATHTCGWIYHADSPGFNRDPSYIPAS